MATLRFTIPSDQAPATLRECSAALSALFALDAHMQLHLDWLVNAAATFGKGPDLDDDQTRDARAVANAQVERMRALRSDLADLAADAEAQLPPGMASRGNIVSEPELPELPDTVGPPELGLVERSFSAGMARHVHTASMALRPLRRRLYALDDEPSRMLAEHIDGFLSAVHS